VASWWSVDFHGDDWFHRISPAQIVQRVMNRLAANHNRGVLLLHDIHGRTATALPSLLAQLKEQGYKVVHVVPAEPKLASPDTPVASASPDGTGLPAAATDPAAARRAPAAPVAAASVAAGSDVETDHPARSSSLRKRLVLRNNNKAAFTRRLAVARARQGTQPRFAGAHLTPARAPATARVTQAHAAVTQAHAAVTPPRRAMLIQRAGASAKPTQACANCRLVPAKRVHPGSPRA
jgi:hypothetical protein